MSDPLSVYCNHCSAAPGTPCSNFAGQDVEPHIWRLNYAAILDEQARPLFS